MGDVKRHQITQGSTNGSGAKRQSFNVFEVRKNGLPTTSSTGRSAGRCDANFRANENRRYFEDIQCHGKCCQVDIFAGTDNLYRDMDGFNLGVHLAGHLAVGK